MWQLKLVNPVAVISGEKKNHTNENTSLKPNTSAKIKTTVILNTTRAAFKWIILKSVNKLTPDQEAFCFKAAAILKTGATGATK